MNQAQEPAFGAMLAALRSILISGCVLKDGPLTKIVMAAIAKAEAEQKEDEPCLAL